MSRQSSTPPQFGFWLSFHDLHGEPALTQIEFRDPSHDLHTGLSRGHTPSQRGQNWSTFVWSKAVKALTVLLVRRALFSDRPELARLSGGRGSLASSLDYAIAKQPDWLVDLFGSDVAGRSRFLRLVDVINPSRKRPDPVTITLRADRVAAAQIHILVDDRPAAPRALEALLSHLESDQPALIDGSSSSELSSSESWDTGQVPAEVATLNKAIESLPDLPPEDLLDSCLEQLKNRKHPIIVLEDDAAGVQLASGIPSVLEHGVDDLEWLLRASSVPKLGFITHPSRGHDEKFAYEAFYDSARRLAQIVRRENLNISWATRFDSCLRGHNSAEMKAVEKALSDSGLPPFDLEVFAPSFYQAGRITFMGAQLIKSGDSYIPVSDTEYAKMPGFEYSTPRVLDVLKTERTRPAREVSAKQLRSTPVKALVEHLSRFKPGTRIVVDSIHERDSITAALVFLKLEALGKRILYRAAPSLLLSLIGERPSPHVSLPAVYGAVSQSPGLVVAGSLSGLSKLQLRALSEREDIALVAVDAPRLKRSRAEHVRAAIVRATSLLQRGFTPLITTRLWEEARAYPDAQERDLVLDALAEIVRELKGIPSWLLLKGSDTCLHVLRWGARANRLESLGRLAEGGTLSAVRGSDSPWCGKPIVLFPGNVGGESAVTAVVEHLAGDGSAPPRTEASAL